MGYIKSTTVSALLAESSQLPFESQDEINTVRFLLFQIFNRSHIKERLSDSTAIKKFQLINDKFNFIKLRMRQIQKLTK